MKKKIFFTSLFVITVICLLLFAAIVLKQNNKEYKPQQNIQAPIEVPKNNIIILEEALKSDKPIVAMFYVDWCTYCRRFMPTFDKFAEKYKDKYSFIVINCDEPFNTKMVNDFHIMGFPTLFIIDKEIDHKFPLNMAATANEAVMKEDLDNYLNVRKKIIK